MKRFCFVLVAWALSFPGWAECTITWPTRPTSEGVVHYTPYVDGVAKAKMMKVIPVTLNKLRVDPSKPHTLAMSATNASGEGPRSEPVQYMPTKPVPGQVGAPTKSGCS